MVRVEIVIIDFGFWSWIDTYTAVECPEGGSGVWRVVPNWILSASPGFCGPHEGCFRFRARHFSVLRSERISDGFLQSSPTECIAIHVARSCLFSLLRFGSLDLCTWILRSRSHGVYPVILNIGASGFWNRGRDYFRFFSRNLLSASSSQITLSLTDRELGESDAEAL